jgi:hypothetical protein
MKQRLQTTVAIRCYFCIRNLINKQPFSLRSMEAMSQDSWPICQGNIFSYVSPETPVRRMIFYKHVKKDLILKGRSFMRTTKMIFGPKFHKLSSLDESAVIN